MGRKTEEFADGRAHGLEPMVPLDPDSVTGFSDLLSRMSRTAFGGRALGQAADVLCEMFGDPDCFVVLTLSGAMTIAKQGRAIAALIARGCVQAVVSTGAIICHGLVEELGKPHFKLRRGLSDSSLYEWGYNRVYDSVELERSMDEVDAFVTGALAGRDGSGPLSSRELCRMLGRELSASAGSTGVLQAAYEREVPVFVPAFTDSELGLDLLLYNQQAGADGGISFDPMLDLTAYLDAITRAATLGIFTIGGGVPRNWAQQMGPYLDILQRRGQARPDEGAKFKYGVRICPEPAHWGGLSGCTYAEGVSWGKFVAPEEGGRFAEVHCDATIVLPLLVVGVLERLGLRTPPAPQAPTPRDAPGKPDPPGA